ncbi:MAG: hypothetical protein J7601_07550 [Chloroflexi bacterium]|jgi:hypothetical protein|nr:hypothetical protein [Chloroflexota bacterium]
MARFSSTLSGVLDILREIDVRAVRAAAEAPFLIVFASRDLLIAEHLAGLLYRGDRAHNVPPLRAAEGALLSDATRLARASLVVIVARADQHDDEAHRLCQALTTAGVPCLMAYLQPDGAPPATMPAVYIPMPDHTIDETTAVDRLVRAIRDMRAVDDLALARHLPAFRRPVVRDLIEETAAANAAYSLGAGLLQINPITGLPVAVADTVVLTKNQLLLAYKITLAMGLPANVQHVMPQVLGVIGGGLALRQAARGAVSLLPALGVAPKVAIAFAGTYAIGEAVYRWCRSEEPLSEARLRALYAQAMTKGRAAAAALWQKLRALIRRSARRPAQLRHAVTSHSKNGVAHYS